MLSRPFSLRSTMAVNLPWLWGSVSQPPSSHLSIHRVPAKLSNEFMPHGVNSCWLRLLFVLESLLLGHSCDSPDLLSGRSTATPDPIVGADDTEASSFTGSLFQHLAQHPCYQRFGKALEMLYNVFFRFELCCLCSGSLWIMYITEHSHRIILTSCQQERIYDPEQLAGYHDQRLHLL